MDIIYQGQNSKLNFSDLKPVKILNYDGLEQFLLDFTMDKRLEIAHDRRFLQQIPHIVVLSPSSLAKQIKTQIKKYLKLIS